MILTEKYDHVVVGAGISGMTAALLLALNGRKVLLLEKAPAIGGSMARFHCHGVPFDTGFHFTGGFGKGGGLLYEMLQILGIRDQIHSQHFADGISGRFVFEQTGETVVFPATKAKLQDYLEICFPDDAGGVAEYFRRVDDVCDRTVNMDIRCINNSPDMLDEDYVSLQSVLDDISDNEKLKTLLASYCMCYGVKPSDVSFANHARICQGMYEEMVRVENGGDAFVDSFRDALSAAGVDVLCNRHIITCGDIEERMVGFFHLNKGEVVYFDSAVFTIHPKDILEIIPKEYLRNAFVTRVSEFEPSAGFFSVFAICDDPDLMDDCMVTLFPDMDLNGMLEPGSRDEDSALFFVSNEEKVDGSVCRTITALEVSCPEDLEEWADSSVNNRPIAYTAYKEAKTRRIIERIIRQFPELKGHLSVLTSSSVLTFRDYLNSPEGSAYGVKQKMGQYNLFGKLPLRNLYVAGQSSLLPGVMGAMMSSFVVVRALIDKNDFMQFINRRIN